MSFGIAAFGDVLGTPVRVEDAAGEYTSDIGRILAYGYRFIYRCPPEIGLTDLAVEAGEKALRAASLDPEAVDLVILAVTDLVEYLYWDAAASLAHRLGARRAECVLLTQACTTGVMSLDTVAGKLATHAGYRTALVVAANRCCEAYWNRMDTQPTLFSDGAVAVVAQRDHRDLRWLGTEVITDGEFADFFRLDAGGAAAPFGLAPMPSGGGSPGVRDAWDIMEFFQYDTDRFEEFIELCNERTRIVVERACSRAGTRIGDLAKVITLHDNARAIRKLADRIGIPVSRTNAAMAAQYGHLGSADQLFSVEQYAARGELTRGDKVALVAMGRGMHWACTLLEV